MAGFSSRCYKHGRKTKKLFRRRAQSTPSSACACLHGLFHGYPGTQPSSPMPTASPAIARARRAPNLLHLLLTVIGRHDRPLRTALRFGSLAELHGPSHSTPTCWAHAPHGGACAQHVSFFRPSPWRAGSVPKRMRVGGSVSRQGQILDFE